MFKLRYILGQIIAFIPFAMGIGYFSDSPSYTYHDPEKALIMVSFSHASEHKDECRRFSQEELSAMAPNMRRPMDCSRERVPVYIELMMDGQNLLSQSYNPTGLAKDGAASIYESIPVEPGQHEISVKLRDSSRESGFDYEGNVSINLDAKELFVIDFRKDHNGFNFQ
ncbi:MAG: hypothetical protein HND53_13765 [Proteobacteria bacterium]|nr:hypothetical protein [Pseudomonadota bacterium]NOG61564.1 hypothetical protein [Pseudomonadota bacterium]